MRLEARLPGRIRGEQVETVSIVIILVQEAKGKGEGETTRYTRWGIIVGLRFLGRREEVELIF